MIIMIIPGVKEDRLNVRECVCACVRESVLYIKVHRSLTTFESVISPETNHLLFIQISNTVKSEYVELFFYITLSLFIIYYFIWSCQRNTDETHSLHSRRVKIVIDWKWYTHTQLLQRCLWVTDQLSWSSTLSIWPNFILWLILRK